MACIVYVTVDDGAVYVVVIFPFALVYPVECEMLPPVVLRFTAALDTGKPFELAATVIVDVPPGETELGFADTKTDSGFGV